MMVKRLNIKSEEARRLASELVALTGETLTEAVTTALRERLDQETRSARTEALAGDIPSRRPPDTANVRQGGLDDPGTGLPT
jgi:antitoxin VapB